ncbi:RND transporter [Desulfocarbo indianensis]|nr:RND transporter [Desulfocarbo indianensis]
MKALKNALINFSIKHYKVATWMMVVFTAAMCAFFPMVEVDTDPENMLPRDDPKRIFHNETKKNFALSETVVVGVVNEHDPDGVFNPATLQRIFELTEFAKGLRWQDESQPQGFSGVIEVDMFGPSLVDHMSQGGPGEIKFAWLMNKPPATREEALAIRDKAYSNPMLKGRMFSEDGKVICLYLPLTDKHLSYRINSELNKKIAQMKGDEEYHIAGVPVAEVAIGVEMFSQMSVGSPLAMLVIFGLMFLFFRKMRIIILPMIIATFSVMATMGLMIALGFQVHILSSMIPIFLMCIGTVSSIHILSEFFDTYTQEKGREESIKEVMHTLFTPIFYTSLTTAAGFASLTFTPIPPAQVFGAFLSVGVMIAWLYTVIFAPAYIMMIPERKLANFGMSARQTETQSVLAKILWAMGRLTSNHAKLVIFFMAMASGLALWGTLQILVNDNYAKRFVESHPIRKADIAMNRHLDGTYTAYLILRGFNPLHLTENEKQEMLTKLREFADGIKNKFPSVTRLAQEISQEIKALNVKSQSYNGFFDTLIKRIDQKSEKASDDDYYAYDELRAFLGVEKEKQKVFKQPKVLSYIAALQRHMESYGLIGKTTSLVDAVRKVNQEMIDGKLQNYRIPDKMPGVAECLLQFQQGHRPKDLWHMVTPDFMNANVWVQLKSGDSSAMKAAVETVDDYFKSNPPPAMLTHKWAGLHYINLVLQDKLIPTMLRSFLGSFLVVFLMMSFLFRSIKWGILCMVPLTITILIIYGLIGWFGKDYDLPIAVLGVLALGMAVDFAIHFLQRARVKYRELGTWDEVVHKMFGEPARAISKNVLVIAIGFLPLLVGPLVPYKTMGIMLFAIMTLSGIVTLFALPAILTVTQKWFFNKIK